MGQSNGDQGPELAPSQGDGITSERHLAPRRQDRKAMEAWGQFDVEYVREPAAEMPPVGVML